MDDATPKRALVLVSDAFGGRGGIASYNRDMIHALCDYPQMERVVCIPRHVFYSLEQMPNNLDYRLDALGGKLKYLLACLRTSFSEPRFDLIICGHVNLLPFAHLLGMFYGCRVIPVVYGIDAWTPTPNRVVNYLCHRLESFISIRRLTARRLIEWAKIPHEKYYYLPNSIDESRYGIRPRNEALVERYGIAGKTVVMSAGRLDAISYDTRKGFDEILEVLPNLKERIPNIVYLIMGDGSDRSRLSDKAKALGVQDAVIFTGYVSDDEKADHYRLAGVFAMPGSSPIFDRYPYRFVFLEALACGVPVVGSKLDDPWEVNDPESRMIIQVDPNDKEEIIHGIIAALSCPKNILQPGLERFYFDGYKARLHLIIKEIIS